MKYQASINLPVGLNKIINVPNDFKLKSINISGQFYDAQIFRFVEADSDKSEAYFLALEGHSCCFLHGILDIQERVVS